MYLAFQAFVFCLCVVLLAPLPIQWWWQVLLYVALICYAGRLLFQQGLLKGASSITAIKYQQPRWYIERNNEWLPVQVLGDSTVTGLVMVLRFKLENKRVCGATIWRDAMTTDDYRRLTVNLKLINHDQPAEACPHHQ